MLPKKYYHTSYHALLHFLCEIQSVSELMDQFLIAVV